MTVSLSIIVPVYNTAEYIDRCLASLQAIPLKELEIIAVNDGSTDNSLDKISEWRTRIPQLRIINQKNGGLSIARNHGLSEATGEYVWFVDSDDWVASEKVVECLQIAKSNQLDFISFGIALSDGKKILKDLTLSGVENDQMIFSGRDYYIHNYVHASACVAFFRRNFLLTNMLAFMPNVLSEDQEFTPRVYFLAKRMMYQRYCLYFYYQRQGSIQKSITPRKFTDFLKICQSLKIFAENNFKNDSEAYECLMNQVAFCLSQALAHYSPGKAGHTLEAVRQTGIYPVHISGRIPIKARLKYHVMNMSLQGYILLRQVCQRLF